MCCKNKNNNKVLKFIFVFVLAVLHSLAFAGNPAQGTKVKTIVIDPGHGGQDPGAIGLTGKREANLALAVALKFGEMVESAFPDVNVIYTRKTDKFVSLNDRAEIANKAKADLFFCIHLNAATNREAFGSSTYVLGLHKTEDNLEVAKRENAVIELEGEAAEKYEFNPNSPEGHIIMSMKQNAFLDQSIKIASNIENEFALRANRKSRGVKQAGFYVLYKTSMPSILAEIGFISNPKEEQFLSSAEGQSTIADALFTAFKHYKNNIENGTATDTKAEETKPVKKEEPVVEQPKTIEKPVVKETLKPKEVVVVKPVEKPVEKPVVKETPKPKEEPTKEIPIAKTEPIPTIETPKTTPVAEEQKKEVVENVASNTLTFRLQLCAAKVKPKNYNLMNETMGGLVTEEIAGGMVRYMSHDFNTFREAANMRASAKKIGYVDAYVVGYKNGERMSQNELAKYMK